MRVCTIISDDWIDRHLIRWVRYVRKNVKDAELYLIHVGKATNMLTHPVMDEFKKIHMAQEPMNRFLLNSVRMKATELFSVDEILYLDADCDVLEDLSGIVGLSDKPLMCVKSPVVHEACIKTFNDMGLGIPKRVYNNGLIYMRRDMYELYVDTWAEVADTSPHDRIAGTVVFNVMLAKNRELFFELPYEYGVIWWDTQRILDAKVVQWCNSEGQAKREHLEGVWRNSR